TTASRTWARWSSDWTLPAWSIANDGGPGQLQKRQAVEAGQLFGFGFEQLPGEALERLQRDFQASRLALVTPGALDVAVDQDHRRDPTLVAVDALLVRRGEQAARARRAHHVGIEERQQAHRLQLRGLQRLQILAQQIPLLELHHVQ